MTSVSNTISTQTTTFLPKCPSVLQRKEIRATFVKKLARVVSKKAVSIIKTNKINSKQAAQNKKTLLKIVREMTLNIRKERVEKSKADKIDRLAAKEIAQAEKIDLLAAKEIAKADKEANKEVKEAEKIDRLAAKEIAQAEKEQAKADKEANKEAKEAEKIDRLAAKEITQVEKEQAKAEKIVRFAVKEITKAEREAKKNMAVRKAWEEMTQRLAMDAPGAVFSRRPLVVD
jgi:hypothetical protein